MKVVEIDESHSVFLAKPEKLAEVVIGLGEGLIAVRNWH
jgi:hypothetical protein